MMKSTYLSVPYYRLHLVILSCYKTSDSTTTVLSRLPYHIRDQPKHISRSTALTATDYHRLQDNLGYDHKSTELIMSSPLPSLISGITRSGRVTTPLGAASDKKPKSAGAHRETTRRNVNVRPASGKSDSHLQARIAGLKSLCACARFGVVDSLGRFCQEIRKKE